MITLRQLVVHADINGWHARKWFRDCAWKPPHLFLDQPKEVLAMVDRCWGPKMRELVPDLVILAKPQEVVAPKPKTATSIFKEKQVAKWRQQRLEDGE